MNHITVIGAGTMGNGIAHCFAQNKLLRCSTPTLSYASLFHRVKIYFRCTNALQ